MGKHAKNIDIMCRVSLSWHVLLSFLIPLGSFAICSESAEAKTNLPEEIGFPLSINNGFSIVEVFCVSFRLFRVNYNYKKWQYVSYA